MSGIRWCWLLGWTAFFLAGAWQAAGQTEGFKVLVVMSYHETMPWVEEMTEGIESVLGQAHDVRYVFMDTKNDPEGGPEKAKEAHALYRRFKPDGVIAGDDNAQSMFVVPYLKDKVETPVMFCGVNADPETYGYPASNVSGILERQHFEEAIAMMNQLVPDLRKVGFIMKASPTADAIIQELKGGNYLADIVSFNTPRTVDEAMEMIDAMKKTCDAAYVTNLTGLRDDSGKPLGDDALFPMVSERFGKPLFSGSSYNIRFPGVLVAVAKTGQEQGATAAKMLLKAMRGTPVRRIPVTRNQTGKRMINATVLKELGIKPRPEILRGTELVRSQR